MPHSAALHYGETEYPVLHDASMVPRLRICTTAGVKTAEGRKFMLLCGYLTPAI